MDETTVKKTNGITTNGSVESGSDDGSADDEECDVEVWDTLSRSFRQAQTVLDQNHALIQQVNKNHQSKITDNLVKNVALIREINALKNDTGKEGSAEHVVDKSQMIEACGIASYVTIPQI